MHDDMPESMRPRPCTPEGMAKTSEGWKELAMHYDNDKEDAQNTVEDWADSNIEIDCTLTSEIVCPHCGYKYEASWRYTVVGGDTHRLTCRECDKEFLCDTEVEVAYTTRRP